jgi:hypothetical protein
MQYDRVKTIPAGVPIIGANTVIGESKTIGECERK